MRPRGPRAISELIVSALPELRERLVEDGVRRSWAAVVGADVARRARPQRLTNGVLEIAVDNSPWLHELTLRAPDLTAKLHARFAAVTSLRFALTPLPADSGSFAPVAERPRHRALGPDDTRDIEAAVAAIGDETLRDSARRLLTKARRSLTVVMLAALAAGCATQRPVAAVGGDEPPRRMRFVAPSESGDAYYHYSAAQMLAQNARFKEAIAAMEQAIKGDPDSAFLWREMAQWLARVEQPEQALAAARKAVQLAPDDAGTHLTLAELLRAQKKYGEAEAELEKVITLNPSAEEPYLTLARYYVEQKSYDRARTVLLRLA